MIPYGKQHIDEEDIKAVVEVLRSDWLTTGPKVSEFEEAFAQYVGAKHAVAVNSGTAALHATMYAIGIGPCDEVIVPPITFAATANCVVYQGGTPVFSDVVSGSLLVDPAQIESKITSNTKAIIAVDYAGHPCDYDSLRKIADKDNLVLVADACHALGAEYNGQKVGSLADLNIFSFHPVKHITTGEGGMITTNDSDLAERMRLFRNHGITTDHHQREKQGSWFYEMKELGYNYRITDFQCALGIFQLEKLPVFLKKRRELAARYHKAFSAMPEISPLSVAPHISHAYHLYVIRIEKRDRAKVFKSLRQQGVGVNVHYIPVYLHPYYKEKLGLLPGLCPVAEKAYQKIISLPMFPGLTNEHIKTIVGSVETAISQ